MAPRIATGLGLTEDLGLLHLYAGSPPDADAVARGIGWAMPAYRMSIREPMNGDGSAGAEMAPGETGHICFHGPQTFLGYVNDPEATAATLSTDGWLYTGDMGHIGRGRAALLRPGQMGAEALRLPGVSGRRGGSLQRRFRTAWPASAWWDTRTGSGAKGIVAFVEKRPGADLTEAELRKHARAR